MKTMKKHSIFFAIILVSLLFTGCKYDFILPEEVPPVDPNVPVLFAAEVAPIFTTNTCTQCHKPGSQSPDLTQSKVYSELVPKYVNTSSPETSIILVHPGSANHSQAKFTQSQLSVILAWITQGAKNN
jgi:hypothetical protein